MGKPEEEGKKLSAIRRDDAQIKQDSYLGLTFYQMENHQCKKTCSYGKFCMQKLTVGAIRDTRKKFWGPPEEAVSSKLRSQRLKELLDLRYDTTIYIYNQMTNFCFFNGLSPV